MSSLAAFFLKQCITVAKFTTLLQISVTIVNFTMAKVIFAEGFFQFPSGGRQYCDTIAF